jgi:hypothetical protein
MVKYQAARHLARIELSQAFLTSLMRIWFNTSETTLVGKIPSYQKVVKVSTLWRMMTVRLSSEFNRSAVHAVPRQFIFLIIICELWSEYLDLPDPMIT